MNYDNRDKIQTIFCTIDAINADMQGLCQLKKELANNYPRITISWGGLSYNERIDIGTHNHAIETLCNNIEETLHDRLEILIESLNDL